MRRRIALICGLLVVAVPSVAAAAPPRPGTTDSGLTDREEATLWSNVPADTWDTDPESGTTMRGLAARTDLTFTAPPGTAERWNRYAHEQFQPGGRDVSIHPETAETDSNRFIADAHASIFSVTPSTQLYVAPDDTRRYVAPEGTLRGAIDYRIDLPDSTSGADGSSSWRLVDDGIEAVKFSVDGEQVATASGTASPEFDYELDGDQRTLRLEARIEATVEETIRPPPSSNRSTRTVTHETWLEVWSTLTVDVYTVDATARHATYPDGREGISVANVDPWQGYTLDQGDRKIRGVWRFFTARYPDWQRLVASSEAGETERQDSHALPVSVYAYPSAMAPRAKPEAGGPTILRTWGSTHPTPKPSLPDHVTVEVVDGPYNETYGMAVRDDAIDLDAVRIHGIVHGVDATVEPLLGDSQRIREASLSATVVESTDGNATVRVELEDAETGAPIQLDGAGSDPDPDTVAPTIQSGHIEIGDRRVRTDANGQATVRLTDPGVYSVRYDPEPWDGSYLSYAGASTTVRWNPLTSPSGWLAFGLWFGLLIAPFAIAWYAGRRLAAMLRVGSRGGSGHSGRRR